MPDSRLTPRTGESRRRLTILAAIVAAATVCIGWFSGTAPARLIDGRLFDIATTAFPRAASPRVVVVAIDEPSFADLGQQWPWPRGLHAQLIEALRNAGARAIAVDLVFAEPSSPEDDEALAAALGPDVVLAADETLIDGSQAAQLVRTEPLPEFTASGAKSGLANLPIEPDGTVRRFPRYTDALSARLVEAFGRKIELPPEGTLIGFAGPPRTYQTVSYYQALDPSNRLPPNFFEGKLVLIGLSLQTAPTVEGGGADGFSTPWTTRTGRLTSGVEIHATVVDNLLNRTYVTTLPSAATLAAILVSALMAAALVLRDTRPRTVVAGMLGMVLIAGVSAVLLVAYRTWLPPAPSLAAFAAVLGGQGLLDFARERRTRLAITNAFRHYLAPELVERLARDPSLLQLGGERRTLTILFCDVRGFTAIAERMKDDPHGLTTLVNRLLDPLSEQVLEHGGTIDKYIGDCVMAFWNAPLDDPDHAANAVTAALGMAVAANKFGELVAAEASAAGETLDRIAVGIGINTGDAVVGNMGSSTRFDYSVLGDAVNLASRLEATCRTYEVPMVIGESTRAIVADRFATALLDRVTVKGRSDPVAIYTVVGAMTAELAELVAEHDAAVEDVLAGRASMEGGRFAALRRRIPQLADYYRRLAARYGSPA